MLVRLLVTAGLVLTVSGAADAATLATGATLIESNGFLICAITNISEKKTVEVTITTVLTSDDTSTSNIITLGPGVTADRINPNGGGLSQGYCIFDVKGGKKNVRASACGIEASGGTCKTTLPAL